MKPIAISLLACTCLGGFATAARATPPDDPNSIVTVQIENDAVSTLKGTSDQYYTAGQRLGYTSPTGILNGTPLGDLGHDVWGDGVQRVSIDVEQSIFTPRDTQAYDPPLGDRPYTATLTVTPSLIQDSDLMRNQVSLILGVMGSAAGGRQVQNGFHNLIGDTPNRGWRTQLGNEPDVGVFTQRIYRIPTGSAYGIESDVLPFVAVQGSSIRDYGQLGGVVRFGQGLDSDFGAPRIQPGISGADAYTATRPFAWYAFGGLDGQAVAYDATLQGNPWGGVDSRHVDKVWDVGELEAGLAVLWHGLRISYTQTWQTQEFHGQKAGLFNFGSFALSAKF